jgi:hypothetical protein
VDNYIRTRARPGGLFTAICGAETIDLEQVLADQCAPGGCGVPVI